MVRNQGVNMKQNEGVRLIRNLHPVSKWYEYISDPTLADAIMDRMTANAIRIELKGESLRRKKSKTNQ